MKRFKNAILVLAVIGATVGGAAVIEKIGILATADQTVKLGDSVELWLGSGTSEQDPTVGDVQVRWDGTDLDVLPAADDSVFKIGNGTLSMDAWLYGNTANDYLLWDASAGSLTFTGAALLKTSNISPVGASALTIGGASATQVDITTDGGTVTIDGVGITPAGITSVPASGTWTFTKTSAGGATLIGADDAGAADTTLDTTGAGAITIGSADVTGITLTSDGGTLDVATASTLTLTALTTADAVFMGADAAGAANTTLDTTGAGAITIGSADVTAITLTTDGTGDGSDVVLPTGAVSTGEVLNDTLLSADFAYAGHDIIQICGDLTTVSNNTVYYGPNRAVVATTASGMTCDTTAAGDTTEATADGPAYTAKAFQVTGMTCRTVDLGNTISFTLRTAAGATVPSVTCSVADNELDCVADVQTTTAIASGATVAVAAASTGDIGTGAFVCNISVIY